MDKDNILEIHRENYKYPIYLRNYTSDVWIYREIIEDHEYEFTVKEDPKYIIDAGANIGMAAIYFANRYKHAKIIAIEPEADNFEILKLNVSNYINIQAIKAALWNTSGEIMLFDTDLDNVGFMTGTTVSALKPIVKKVKHLVKELQLMKFYKNMI